MQFLYASRRSTDGLTGQKDEKDDQANWKRQHQQIVLYCTRMHPTVDSWEAMAVTTAIASSICMVAVWNRLRIRRANCPLNFEQQVSAQRVRTAFHWLNAIKALLIFFDFRSLASLLPLATILLKFIASEQLRLGGIQLGKFPAESVSLIQAYLNLIQIIFTPSVGRWFLFISKLQDLDGSLYLAANEISFGTTQLTPILWTLNAILPPSLSRKSSPIFL